MHRTPHFCLCHLKWEFLCIDYIDWIYSYNQIYMHIYIYILRNMIVAMCPVHNYQVCYNGEACNIWKLCYSWLLLMQYRSNFSENMVRKYTRKTDSRAHGEAALCAALVAIQQGQPVKNVAIPMPPQTSHPKLWGGIGMGMWGCHVLSSWAEPCLSFLINWRTVSKIHTNHGITDVCADIYRCSTFDLRIDRVTNLAASLWQEHLHGWMGSFMARHPTLSFRVPVGTS